MAAEDKRARKADKEAQAAPGMSLAQLYARHAPALLGIIKSKVGAGPPDPDDIAQQAFANYAALPDPASVRNPASFLTRSALNLINDHFRMVRRRRTEPADHDTLEHLLLDHDEISPEVVILGRERFDRVVEALKTLPRRRRRFLLLNRLEGLGFAEIARRNGASPTLVRNEVMDAVRVCREAVLKIEGE